MALSLLVSSPTIQAGKHYLVPEYLVECSSMAINDRL